MSVEMAIWRMTATGPVALESPALGLEAHLEDMLVEDPGLVGLDVLVVGRQVTTEYGGYIDVLAVDDEARVHVLELKRDKTPRDVVAQVLDYGSWTRSLTLAQANEIYAEQHAGESLDDAFAEKFGSPLPDVFNPDQQLTIVASKLDPVSDRIVEYLAEGFGVPINAVFFRHFSDGESKYLARTWLLPPEEAAAAQARSGSRSKVRPWNGRDYYVIQDNIEQGSGRWELARKYGYLSAGGGSWYWKPLRNLAPGHRVFAYVGGVGYVGVGEVAGTVMRASEATVDLGDGDRPLLDLPDLEDDFVKRARLSDEDETEYVVPVSWLASRDVDNAAPQRGLFASQVTVCKLRDARTIEVLEKEFGVGDG